MDIRLKPLEDQVVVIVGASSGIGRQTAYRMAERGARLVVVARDAPALEALAAELRSGGAADAMAVAADVSMPAAMTMVADQAVDRFGRIDTWAHVAGIDVWAPFERTPPEEFRRVIEVNLLGVANGAYAALPRLRQNGGGALIVVSSVDGDVPLPDQSAYVASKHGVKGFIRVLRMELEAAGDPIAVAQIQPSAIDTPLFRVARTRLGVEPQPPAPVYDPDIVAELIVHAAEHPSRDLYAGGGGWALALASRYLPGVTDRVMARLGDRMQRSETPKAATSPANVDGPLPVTAVRGGYGGRSFSIANKVQMVPSPVRVGAGLAVLGGLLFLTRSRGEERPPRA
jgi:NAD(P)-dependent dehydrogenase (short-subunit alcohol dehydrogenase family)